MSRKAPSISATTQKVGTVRTGNDRKQWVVVQVQTATGKTYHRWKRYAESERKGKPQTSRTRKYLIHDNGGRPFLVELGKTTATVYRKPDREAHDGDDNFAKYTVLVHKFTRVRKIFVGMDHNPNNSYLPPRFGDGNSILLYMGKTGTKCKYVSIGASIFAFQTDNDVITHYYSDIGNNDVPYPVAVGNKYVYFLTADTQVDKSAFAPNVEWHAAYEEFYGSTDNPWYARTYGKVWHGFARARSAKLKQYVRKIAGMKVLTARR